MFILLLSFNLPRLKFPHLQNLVYTFLNNNETQARMGKGFVSVRHTAHFAEVCAEWPGSSHYLHVSPQIGSPQGVSG